MDFEKVDKMGIALDVMLFHSTLKFCMQTEAKTNVI